jgi:hypothetical protein
MSVVSIVPGSKRNCSGKSEKDGEICQTTGGGKTPAFEKSKAPIVENRNKRKSRKRVPFTVG